MPLSEYARSEYEEDSEFVISEEEDDGALQDPPALETNPSSPRSGKPRLEILDDSTSDPSLSSPNGNHPHRSANGSVISGDNNSTNFINHVDQVMNQVKSLEADPRWSRVLKHRTGVEVFAQKHAKSLVKNKTVPIFKGVGLIKGYSPPSVFAVIGSSKLWDEWYEDGNLVDNLSDQISLTYMCMKAGLGSRTRDLSLVEKVEATTDGSIYFCASSVDTPRVPVIPGRIRAHIDLNAWVLQPITLPSSTPGASTTATKVTYYLQVNIKTFVAEAITQRYLARRPLCITKIDAYLQKYGSPSVQLEDGIEAHPHRGGARRSYSRNYMSLKQIDFPKDFSSDNNSGTSSAPNTLISRKIRSHISSIGSFGQKSRHRVPSSVPSPSFNPNDFQNVRSSKYIEPDKLLTNGSPNGKYSAPLLIDHLKPNQESLSWNSINQTLEAFYAYLKDANRNQKDWKMIGISGNSVRMLLNSQTPRAAQAKWEQKGLFHLPMVKSEAILNTPEEGPNPHPITKDQVLLTILSNLAQQIWNQNFHGYNKFGSQTHQHQVLLSTDNGFDQGTYLGTMRAVYPHIRDDSLFCFDQLVVRQPNSSSSSSGNESLMDDSKIVVIHHSIEDEEAYLDQLEKKFVDVDQPPKVNSILREKVEKKVLSKIDVEGWLIQSNSSGEGPLDQIQIVHLSALDLNLKNQQEQIAGSPSPNESGSNSSPASLPEFLSKLISSNIASRPYHVCEFIREFGFAPGFVKWMDGPIQYLGDHDQEQVNQDDGTDPHSPDGIRVGQVEWRFNWKKEQNSGNQADEIPSIKVSPVSTQTCWFQWSEQMYPNGIELVLEPSDIADVRLASDIHNTIQFNWKKVENASTDQVIKLQAKQIATTIDGPLDGSPQQQQRVIFNGNRTIESVALQVVQAKKKKKKVNNTNASGTKGGDEKTKDETVEKGGNKQLRPSNEKLQSSSSQPSPPVDETQASTNTPPSESSKITKTNSKKDKDKQVLCIDPNVAVIINQHLYFTRPQVLFFVICIGCAYLYGRFG